MNFASLWKVCGRNKNLQHLKCGTCDKKHKVYKEVDAVAKELNADLIIMGSQGITIQDGIFAGSNAEKMARNSSTPVLIVKTGPKNFSLSDVVLATDMSVESVGAYNRAENLLSKLGSNVDLVYIYRPNNGFINFKTFTFADAGGAYIGGIKELFDDKGKLTNEPTKDFLKSFLEAFENELITRVKEFATIEEVEYQRVGVSISYITLMLLSGEKRVFRKTND